MPEPQIRLTPQRQAVLDVIRKATDHPTANEIFQRVQAIHPGMAYGTVYTALKALVSHGLIQELKFGDNASRYDGRVERHHHVQCRVCGTLGEVEIGLSDAQWAEVIAQTDFEIHTHHIQFVGCCPRCRVETVKMQGTTCPASGGHNHCTKDSANGTTEHNVDLNRLKTLHNLKTLFAFEHPNRKENHNERN